MNEMMLQDPEMRHKVAESAYYISEAAGFAMGREMDFWLQAESEMLQAVATEVAPKKAARKASASKTAAPKVAAVAEEKVAAPRKRAARKIAD